MIRRVSALLPTNPPRALRLLLAFLPVFVISSFLLIARPDLRDLAGYGYAGVFAVMLLSSASVLLPTPGLAAVAAAGLAWNPLLVGIFGGLGGATGELVAYLAGYGAREMIHLQNSYWAERVRQVVTRRGFLAILLLAAIPNPVFDLVGLAAGSLGYPRWQFFVAVAIGNTIKCTLVAITGGAIRSWLWPG